VNDPFLTHRTRLLALAYRILGSWADAEDVVQDAHVRWLDVDASTIDSPRAWLERTVTNRCLDVLKSARVQRETYVGPWLPEPVPTEGGALHGEPFDPQSLSLAFLTLLERLSPLERAVYVLAVAFDYTHAEIGAALGRDEAAVRQLLHRAREHVRAGRPRFAPDREAHARLLGAFAMACTQGDASQVETLLAQEAVLRSDGGGVAKAALRELHGARSCARFLVGIVRKGGLAFDVEVRDVNGWPAIVAFASGKPAMVLEIETDGTRIFSVSMVLNPAKLTRFAS
jgi:RNA polymerase sigma-70 factor (ECF subfamily)